MEGNEYHEVIGVREEGTVVLLLLDGHPPIPFDRRAFEHMAEERGFPDGLRGHVKIIEDGIEYMEEDQPSKTR